MGEVRKDYGLKEENSWTFGQIVPLILLAAPLAGLLDHFSTPSTSTEKEESVRTFEPETEPSRCENTPTLPWDAASGSSVPVGSYEDSLSFQGAFIFAAMSYIHIAIKFIQVADASSIGLLQLESLPFLGTYPAIQGTWIIGTLWIPKLGLSKVRANFILITMFSTLLLLACWQIVVFEGYWISQLYHMAMLVFTHYVLVGWFFLHTCVLKLGLQHNRKWYQNLVSTSLKVAVSLAVPIPLVLLCIWQLGARWEHLMLQFGAALLVQAMLYFVEWKIQQSEWECAPLVRGCLIICLVGATFVVFTVAMYLEPYVKDGFDDLTTLFPMIYSTFPVWMAFWACCDALKRRKEGRQHLQG